MAPSFKIPSLLNMCLEQISRLVERGTWNGCEQNPFSSIPIHVMDILLNFLVSVPFIRTRHLSLILQSGQFSKLELSALLLDKEKHLLVKWMSTDACKNLRVLTVLHPVKDESVVSVVADILQRCHNLEEFHSKLVIDMNALKNCNGLRSLRLHLQCTINAAIGDLYHTVIDFAQSKQNLTIFSFCNIKDGFAAYRTIAAILENCPQIISVGFTDSLEALQYIRETRGTAKFNLQRCYWGFAKALLKLPKSSSYTQTFPSMIENAVQMCPDVETLVINVYHEDAFEHLIHLQKLKSLSVKFIYNSADNISSLILLLRRIGPALEHLSLDINGAFPLEIIRDFCFNLKYLQIYGTATLSDGTEDCLNPLKLERLSVWRAKSSSLYFLLRNSPNLKELFLGYVTCFDDQLMNKIFKGDFMFPRLSVVGIMDCVLSSSAIDLLFSRACNLEEIIFGSADFYKRVQGLIIRNGLTILSYFDSLKLQNREFYIYRPDPCSF